MELPINMRDKPKNPTDKQNQSNDTGNTFLSDKVI